MGGLLKQIRFAAFFAACICFGTLKAQNSVRPSPPSTLSFVKNCGQWDAPFLYKTDIPYGTVFLEKACVTYNFISRESSSQISEKMHHFGVEEFSKPVHAYYHAYKMLFKNGNEDALIKEENRKDTYHNYYLGNDPSKWKTGVPLFGKIIYENIYKNINYEIIAAGNTLKYNLEINPGGNVHDITLHYDGCELQVVDGKLKIHTSVSEVIDEEPFAYQYINGKLTQVPCMFTLNGNNDVSFSAGRYDHSQPLIIDPVLVFATYSGSTADNFGFTAAFDSEGDLYSGGITEAKGYPVTIGAFQEDFQGGSGFRGPFGSLNGTTGWDITISKYNPVGTALLYATYVGGKDNEYPHSLLVDYNDNLIIMGSTYSSNYPHTPTAFDTMLNSGLPNATDIILTKFSASGTLLASTYLGGSSDDGIGADVLDYNYADVFRGDIIADKDNNYYIGSVTRSGDFPLKNALDAVHKGSSDGVIVKIDSNLSKLWWSTYWGGDSIDGIYSIDLDKQQHVYVSGGTLSNNLNTNSGAYQKSINGNIDGFISKLSNDGTKVLASTYIGTNNYDQVYFIEIDNQGNVYGMGQTEGTFPVSSSVYSNTNSGQFIIKLDSNLEHRILSTVFGSSRGVTKANPDISPTAFLVDNCGLIYVCGWGSAITYGTKWHAGTTAGLPIVYTPFPPKYATTDSNDFYLIVFEPNLAGVRYTTFIGGYKSEDHVDGGTSRFDKRGIIYESACASCPNESPPPVPSYNDFPTEPKATVKFPNNVSTRCSNAAFKIDFQLQTAIIADFRATPRVACAPQVFSMNSKSKAVRYYWDFGDGTADTVRNPDHGYLLPGTYKIRLVCYDTNTCNVYDTAYDEVTLLGASKADFDFDISYCDNSVTFKDKSQNRIRFLWSFGDSTYDSVNIAPKHYYKTQGKYSVTLYVNRGLSCADSITKLVDFDLFRAKNLVVPNVFTPNGDGVNDSLEINGINPKCDKFEMKVYNRWGELIFGTKEVGNWWDGKNKKINCPDGVYYYTIHYENYKGEVTDLKGDVTIIR
jgi:gliding motility-associated-like protein